ncbi:MAG: CRISPR-associated endonuclease Cas1 [Paracoccaceae bacterium]
MPDPRPDLWQQATSFEALQLAWAKVDHNQGSAGGDAVSRKEFRDDVFARLNQLRADLLRGSYQSRPFRKVSVPKKKPGYRILTIPSIRDRVLHTAIASTLEPHFEAEFEESSFAYRKGRGVQKAVARIEHWRDRGYDVVIEADIVSYFDNVQHDLLLEKIEAVVGQQPGFGSLIALISSILEDQASALGSSGIGIAQGSPLSPLLANLYLDALDEAIDAQGVKIVRFADDFVILCKSEKKATKVLAHAVDVLGAHGLRLNDIGTRIVSFDSGFDFIGYLFVRSLALQKASKGQHASTPKAIKSEVTDEGVIRLEDEGSRFDQGGRVLYVLDADHCLDIRNRSFSVRQEDGNELIAIPHRRVCRIEAGPEVRISQKAIELATTSSTDLALIDRFGQTKGSLIGRQSRHGGLHLKQAAAVLDEGRRIPIARALVKARVANQREQLQRLNRRQKLETVVHIIRKIRPLLIKVEHAASNNELMGLEGAVAALYWNAIGQLLGASNEVPFVRSRPATDPINASINYLTAILERDTRSAAQTAGLHLGFAFLHGSRNRHDGLVFDLMEPFRAPLTAGLAVFLFRAKRLRPEMFSQSPDDKTFISKEGRYAIVHGYEAAVAKLVAKPDGKGRLGWRAMMIYQARSLAAALTAENETVFFPFRLAGADSK